MLYMSCFPFLIFSTTVLVQISPPVYAYYNSLQTQISVIWTHYHVSKSEVSVSQFGLYAVAREIF